MYVSFNTHTYSDELFNCLHCNFEFCISVLRTNFIHINYSLYQRFNFVLIWLICWNVFHSKKFSDNFTNVIWFRQWWKYHLPIFITYFRQYSSFTYGIFLLFFSSLSIYSSITIVEILNYSPTQHFFIYVQCTLNFYFNAQIHNLILFS